MALADRASRPACRSGPTPPFSATPAFPPCSSVLAAPACTASPSTSISTASTCAVTSSWRRPGDGWKGASGALFDEAPENEADVRGPFAETPHEVREPLAAERNVDAHRMTLD